MGTTFDLEPEDSSGASAVFSINEHLDFSARLQKLLETFDELFGDIQDAAAPNPVPGDHTNVGCIRMAVARIQLELNQQCRLDFPDMDLRY